MTIQNKVIIITGASSGLGEETARHLASKGAKVVLGARRVERLEALVNEIRQNGGQAVAVATDVASREQVEQLAKTALDTFGRIDVLVNNAGIMPMAPMSALKVDEWDKMIDVNVKGVLYGIASVLPTMQAQKSGHIINLSSVAGLKVSGVLVGGGGMRRVSLADAPVQLWVSYVGVVVVGAFLPCGIGRVADDDADVQRLLFVAACAVLFQELIHQVGLFMELEGVG